MSKTFGSVVAGAVAGLFISGVAVAEGAKPATKNAKAEAGWCKSNACGGHVAGAKNSCKGAMACKGITKDACTKDGKGTWETGPKPTK